MKQLADFIKSKIHIEETDLQAVLSKFKERTVNKGQFILKKGQIAHQYFFIKSGGCRFFYGDYEQENTTWVVFQDDFFTEISSLHPQKPSRFNVEAIEKSDMDALYKQIPAWQEFGRKTWQEYAVRMIDMILNFQSQTAEERYLEFMKTPELIQRVPIKHLATYLGITPNALSRIRKNINQYSFPTK
jgi:Cyclic nucleotide-binding domain